MSLFQGMIKKGRPFDAVSQHTLKTLQKLSVPTVERLEPVQPTVQLSEVTPFQKATFGTAPRDFDMVL